jgi:hypothetical protein
MSSRTTLELDCSSVGVTVIGRLDPAGFIMDYPTVSRRHATISFDTMTNTWKVQTISSVNATGVCDPVRRKTTWLYAGESGVLRHGHQLHIGGNKVLVMQKLKDASIVTKTGAGAGVESQDSDLEDDGTQPEQHVPANDDTTNDIQCSDDDAIMAAKDASMLTAADDAEIRTALNTSARHATDNHNVLITGSAISNAETAEALARSLGRDSADMHSQHSNNIYTNTGLSDDEAKDGVQDLEDLTGPSSDEENQENEENQGDPHSRIAPPLI